MDNNIQDMSDLIIILMLVLFVLLNIGLLELQKDIKKNRSLIKQLRKYVEKLNGHNK